MKKFFLSIMAAGFILTTCDTPYFTAPFMPGADLEESRSTVPYSVTATQGGKQFIELSWNEVSGAGRYYIYKAKSPLESFELCGETAVLNFKENVPPGSTFYYRVSAVSYSGTESSQSKYVRGTSLAQPNITDITDVTEENATVTWYMDNVEDTTYKSNLLYTVYCFDGSAEIAQLPLDGGALIENKATFGNLRASTNYTYQVEAYLRTDQNASEKSVKLDAYTARRLRPGAPKNPKAGRGRAKNKIVLTFDLPDEVDIALGDNQYEKRPVYFKISRRQYSASGNNAYTIACSYFGSDAGRGGGFSSYTPDTKVTWTDNNVTRGVEYEYQVQAYVEDPVKSITADTATASAVGWALSEGTLEADNPSYEFNEAGSLYASAKLPLKFNFDPKEETYGYTLVEKIEPIDINDRDPLDPDGNIEREVGNFTQYNDIKNYVAQMDLTKKTTAATPGRGLYSYAVKIKQSGEELDTIETIGKVEVSDNTDPIIVEGFSVQDGYTDKFVFRWVYYDNRKYELFISNNGKDSWTSIGVINPNPINNSADFAPNYKYEYTTGVTTGLTKYFAIRPYRDVGGTFKQGQMVYATAASKTLGVPVLSLEDKPSYSLITATWTEAQKADTYRVKYGYSGETKKTIQVSVNDPKLAKDASGKFRYEFNAFAFDSNAVDVSKAGLEIQVELDALNEGLRTAIGSGDYISTTANEKPTTRLVGPALLSPSATRAVSPTQIDVSWNKVAGADGYYVFRRQFDMDNSFEEGTESIVYYVSSDGASVIGKNLALVEGAKGDTAAVKASVTPGSRLTLHDIHMPDNDYKGSLYSKHIDAYKNQQNDMAQGFSYRYYIVPVVNRGGASEPLSNIDFLYVKNSSNKNTTISAYTIKENNVSVRYNSASSLENEGFIIGFGYNVTATKGTYASSGTVNNGIQINWSLPAKLASAGVTSPRYTLYRKAHESSVWDILVNGVDVTGYVDAPQTRGITYEYVVGIAKEAGATPSRPDTSQRFLDRCLTILDEKNRPKYLGFMLKEVTMVSVSRDERKVGNNFAEEVKWYAGGIKNHYSANNNWGIDGYTIYVMNRNISANWYEFADISSNIPDQIDQIFLAATGMKTVPLSLDGSVYNFDMLRVMRDYKHYFKVRSYVLNGEQKIYCPDPAYTWSNGGQNDYVKWGARQVTTDEFIKIALVYLSDGIDQVNGTAWNTAYNGFPLYGARTVNANGNGTSGSVRAESNFGVSSWDFQFSNYKTDLQLRTEDWVTFVTIDGKIWAGTNASNQYPQRWGDAGLFSVKGPSDTPGLYTGKMKIGNPDDLYWDRGKIYVQYPDGTAQQTFSYRGEDTPLLYSGKGDRRYNLQHFK